MTKSDKTENLDVSGIWHVPSFVTINNVSDPGSAEREFVVSNEVTGRNFLANAATVRLCEALREFGRVDIAMQQAALSPRDAGSLMKRLIENGMAVRSGETRADSQKTQAPIDSRMIMIRWDLLDIRKLTERLRRLGRFAYGPAGYTIWAIAMMAMIFFLLDNREKVALTMRQAWGADMYQWLVFILIFVGLKVFHELGHALAYREMMRQEGHEAGPVRVGICIFAFTPFPFTDVSAAWRLRSRFRRVMIGAGGIYFETWAMAALTLIWAQTSVGLFQTVALQVAIVSGALALLFNLNPAVKLDGYFMLTDAFRLPNLAARGSLAARSWVSRLMGASLPKPAKIELGYWLLSYIYRWTIFAGIFWILYQFDPRLAPIAATLVCLTLVIRPILGTYKFVRKTDAHPFRATGVSIGLIALVAVLFVPFESRLLLTGNVERFETRFVSATEPGILDATQDGWQLHNPDLTYQIDDLRLYARVLENAERASFSSGAEQARIRSQISANTESLERLSQRRASLSLSNAQGVWTDLNAQQYANTWITPSTQSIGAVSQAVPAQLRLSFAETALVLDANLDRDTRLDIRPVNDPDCQFEAKLGTPSHEQVAVDGFVSVIAHPFDKTTACFKTLRHGAPVIARAAMPDLSLAERVWLRLTRALQERLPLEEL